MATAASNRPDAQSEAPHPGATGRARIGIAGATGYAGQELVKILARHPGVTLTTAMASAATSTPRAITALARIWDQPVVPLDVDRLVRDADVVMLALPEAASAELAPTLLARGVRVVDLSGAFRIRNEANRQRWYPATAALPDGTVYGLTEGHQNDIRQARLALDAALLSDRRAVGARTAAPRRPAHRLDRGRREIRRLGRRQNALGAHALLGEPWQRRGLRRVRPPPHRRDRAGAGCRCDVRAASGA